LLKEMIYRLYVFTETETTPIAFTLITFTIVTILIVVYADGTQTYRKVTYVYTFRLEVYVR